MIPKQMETLSRIDDPNVVGERIKKKLCGELKEEALKKHKVCGECK